VAAYEFGPPDRPIDVVLSHANSFNALTYRTVLAPAAEQLRILAYDLRGHGATRLPTEVEGRNDWSDAGADLAALIEALDLTNVVLAGHSMGATTTLLAVPAIAGRVRSLALFDPVIPPLDGPAKARSEAGNARASEAALRRRNSFPSPAVALESFVGRGAFATWPRAMVADYVEGGLRALDDGTCELACAPEWEASGYRAQAHDMWSLLREAQKPTIILRGGEWSSAALDAERLSQPAYGHITVETVPGTGHFLPMERPDAVRDALAALAA